MSIAIVERLAPLHQLLRTEIDRRQPEPLPPFDFSIGWSESYDDLFLQRFTSKNRIQEIPTRALISGRVLIHARGGGAKTSIVCRLIRERLDTQTFLVLINLKDWTSRDYDVWDSLPSAANRWDFLFRQLSYPKTDVATIAALPSALEKFVFVDGLNELFSSTAEALLDVLDEFAALVPTSGVVVTDRLVRRTLREPSAWSLATVLPLDSDQIKHHLRQRLGSDIPFDHAADPAKELLALPYFLDEALKEGRLEPTGTAAHDYYFRTHVSLTEEEILRTADAAYSAYQENKTRSFPLQKFSDRVGPQILAKLRQEHVLLVTDDRAYFNHHLRHDYFCAVHLARHLDLWRSRVFTRVTFSASSFETLAMTLELLDTADKSDLFVRHVYDWNQYGAAFAVSEGHQRGRVRVSDTMEIALLAMLAERRWDLMTMTAERVTDALHMFQNPLAKQFLEARDRGHLSELIGQMAIDTPLFSRWRELFTRPSGTPADNDELHFIREDDLIGWTYANLLKRQRLTVAQQASLTKLLNDASETVRWRVVHALGAFANKENTDRLLKHLDHDPEGWVRYGAVRSLLEIAAAADRDLRVHIVTALEKRASRLVRDESSLKEIERAVFVDPKRAPDDWPGLMIRVIRALNNEDSTPASNRWEQLAYRIRRTYVQP